MQPLTAETDAYAYPPSMSKQNKKTYLKVTALPVAPSGHFSRHIRY